MKRSVLAVLLAGSTITGIGFFVHLHRASPAPEILKHAISNSPLAHADANFSTKPREAAAEYESFVAKNSGNFDPKVQDRVGSARMRLGYLAARVHDLPKARASFLAASKIKGTSVATEFGTVSDQAAYQAVVCLVAQGNKKDAVSGFEALLSDRPLSPLARAAYQRLKRLNGGESKPEWDRLMQVAVAKQEGRIRFETSVCGPKCLERITGKDYKTLASLCGTTDTGTTVEGMRKGLKALGKVSWAARLNRRDLEKAKLPAVVFQVDHYVVLESIANGSARVWDPRFASYRRWRLPLLDDPDFSATVILLARPEGI